MILFNVLVGRQKLKCQSVNWCENKGWYLLRTEEVTIKLIIILYYCNIIHFAPFGMDAKTTL